MAFVSDGLVLNVAFADNSGKVVNRSYEVVETNYATAFGLADDWVATIQAASDSVVVSWFLAEKMIQDTVVLPAAGVQNENQVIVTGKLLGQPNESGYFSIPGAKITCFQATSGPNADIASFVAPSPLVTVGNLFIDGGAFYISDGENLVTPLSGRRRHTKSASS